VQEVAFTLANGIAYVQAALDAGINVNVLGQRLSFFFNVHNHFLEEIAKFRAARRLWARIMRDRFGATEPRAQQLRFHAQTAGSTLTAQQPDNNVARVAIQALAAVLGGTQSLHCNGRDEALGLPTQESATIALRTQQILLHESGVASTVDPLGGAYAIEEATTRIEKEAVQIIERIDSAGGTLSAIESGLIQRDIQDSAYRAQQALEHGNDVVVGVNRYTESSGHMLGVFSLDASVERDQVERVRMLRASRSGSECQAALEAVVQAARGSDNLVPVVIHAVEQRATLGEVSDALRNVFGEYQDVSGT
jgi:methylmalonyl-CoA mutase N-terminal domain/subunit